nr:hypothetical protein [Tanacetum cinerariifolium]
MGESLKLLNESHVLYDRVMYPLTTQQERKTRKDYGMRRGRHFTSSSSTFGQPSSSYLNDDDDDGNDEGTSRASTPSPTHSVNSLTNEMFRVNDLNSDEVIVDVTVDENVEQSTKVAEKEVSTADPDITSSELVTTAKDVEIKAAKPKAREVIVQESSEFRTTSSSQPSQLAQAKEKGKGIVVEPGKHLKKKDQTAFNKEVARKLEAQMNAEIEEEERIAREKD